MSLNCSGLIASFLDKVFDKKISVNVIGDTIIDEYYDVEVERISPEFPIPVYKSRSIDPTSGLIPGGAANVALQFQHFNVNVELISLLDNISQVIFESKGIKSNHSKVLGNIFIPRKRRIYSQNTPLVRHDFEKENYGLDDIKKQLFELSIPESDFNIFSDYSKGLFCIPWFRKYMQKSPSIVDPKHNFIDLWEGCNYFKPNSIEAEKLSERKNHKDQLEFFMDALKCQGVLITKSGDGVVGKDVDHDYFEVKPNHKIENPESVIGAGDCFVAFVTMALARGFNLEQAAHIAFIAGSAYVQRKHNRPLCPVELLSATGTKEIKNAEILKNRNFKLVFTNGCFDFGLTAAHVECFKFAKSHGDKLVVALNSDRSVSRLKGRGRPLMPFNERLKVLSALESVDYVIGFEDDTPYETIKDLMPDLIVKGGDYTKEEVVGYDLAPVELFPFINSTSTTDKINKYNNL